MSLLKNTKVLLGLNIMTNDNFIGHSTLDFALDKLFCYYDALTVFCIFKVNGSSLFLLDTAN